MNAQLWCIYAVAEGGAYGAKEAGGNSFSYWFLALAFAGSAAFAAAAPHLLSLLSHSRCAASYSRLLLVAVPFLSRSWAYFNLHVRREVHYKLANVS